MFLVMSKGRRFGLYSVYSILPPLMHGKHASRTRVCANTLEPASLLTPAPSAWRTMTGSIIHDLCVRQDQECADWGNVLSRLGSVIPGMGEEFGSSICGLQAKHLVQFVLWQAGESEMAVKTSDIEQHTRNSPSRGGGGPSYPGPPRRCHWRPPYPTPPQMDKMKVK